MSSLTKPNHNTMKPGIYTTEFWLSLAVAITAAALAFFEQVDGTVAVVTTTVLGGLYTILRSALKSKAQ